MVKQCKGKDISKIPSSKLDWIHRQKWFVSIKLDGQYIQIQKKGNSVKFFTSGGKEFYLKDIATYLIAFNKDDFILECEFIGKSEGNLGDRTKCGILTTWRTEYSKGISTTSDGNRFVIFDKICLDKPFEKRLDELYNLRLPDNMVIVKNNLLSFSQSKALLHRVVRNGKEGLYLKHPNHMYRPGKRVNDAIKLKKRPTADLLCIGIEPGEGKYTGMIGSLVLRDSKNRIVKVGSGLDDILRDEHPSYFVGKIIEIEYEQILDTYIQPTFIRVRTDKLDFD